MSLRKYDAIVIGGGFFGCSVALGCAARGARVLVLEQGQDLLERASFVNQARVHAGYHYPRSILTAQRSAANYPRFVRDFADCLDSTFEQIYAIARGHSKVSAYQFVKFCERAGIPCRPAPVRLARLFTPELIEQAFLVEECAFNATRLRGRLRDSIAEKGVEIRVSSGVNRVTEAASAPLAVHLEDETLLAERVFSCTYSETNNLLGRSGLPLLPLKHELTEMAMIRVPAELARLGITVMDGPFFSTMPFPALGLHSLSHVSYTPHEAWLDDAAAPVPSSSKGLFMLRDARRYLPLLGKAQQVTSLFTTKTVLRQNETDDGRPILCRRDYVLPGFTIILGAKVDNVYDVLEALDLAPSFAPSHAGIGHSVGATA